MDKYKIRLQYKKEKGVLSPYAIITTEKKTKDNNTARCVSLRGSKITKVKSFLALLLTICILGTSCTTIEQTKSLLAAGSLVGGALSISLPIIFFKTDEEKAQSSIEKYTKQIMEATTFEEIQSIVSKANQTAEKNKEFKVSSLEDVTNKKLNELNIPLILNYGKLDYNIKEQLAKVTNIIDIENIISEAKSYNTAESTYPYINHYFKQNYIPYEVTDTGTIQLATDLEKIKGGIELKAVDSSDITILIDWIMKYTKELEEYYQGNIYETIGSSIKSCIISIIENAIPDNIKQIKKIEAIDYAYYYDFIQDYLNMSQNEYIEYINTLTSQFVDEYNRKQALEIEEKIYNQAIEEKDPIIYTSQYPNGNFDSSAIPTDPIVLEYRDALTSYEKAKEFVKDFPYSKYTSTVYDYIYDVEKELWHNSYNYKYLTQIMPQTIIDREIYGLKKTLREYIEEPSEVINEESTIIYSNANNILTITCKEIMLVFKIRQNFLIIDLLAITETGEEIKINMDNPWDAQLMNILLST